MVDNQLTEQIIGCSIIVHKELGPGLLESVYESALAVELSLHGLNYQCQHPLKVFYKGNEIGHYRVDVLVEDQVVVELKATERHEPVFEAQLLSYMKLGGYKVGLLINFNSGTLVKGVKRFVL